MIRFIILWYTLWLTLGSRFLHQLAKPFVSYLLTIKLDIRQETFPNSGIQRKKEKVIYVHETLDNYFPLPQILLFSLQQQAHLVISRSYSVLPFFYEAIILIAGTNNEFPDEDFRKGTNLSVIGFNNYHNHIGLEKILAAGFQQHYQITPVLHLQGGGIIVLRPFLGSLSSSPSFGSSETRIKEETRSQLVSDALMTEIRNHIFNQIKRFKN